jgi:hypothetical protein
VTTALTNEQVQQHRRDQIRAMVDGCKAGEWVSRAGGEIHIRTGHAIDHDDAVRRFRPTFHGEECPDCGRDLWVPITCVTGRDRAGHEKLADRLLCRACGHEKPDERESTRD